MPISEDKFYGGAQYLTIGSAGVTALTAGKRFIRIAATVPGVIVQLPERSSIQNASVEGGPVIIVAGVGTGSSFTLRSPDGGTDISITPSESAYVFYTGEDTIMEKPKFGAPASAVYATTMKGIVGALAGTGATDESDVWNHFTFPAESIASSAAINMRGYPGVAGYKKADAYVFGFNNTLDTVIERYSRTGSWSSTGKDTSMERFRGFAGTIGASVYMFGGDSTDLDALVNPETTATVVVKNPMPLPREKASAVSAHIVNRVFVALGSTDQLPPWFYHAPSDTYETLADIPASNDYRDSPAAFIYGTKRALFAGGLDIGRGEASDVVDEFDVVTRVWSAATAMSANRGEAGGFAIGETGYVAGGIDETPVATDTIFRHRAGTWSSVTATLSATGTKMPDGGEAVEG